MATITTDASNSLNSFSIGNIFNDVWDTAKNVVNGSVQTLDSYWNSIVAANATAAAQIQNNARMVPSTAAIAPASSAVVAPGSMPISTNAVIALAVGAALLLFLVKK